MKAIQKAILVTTGCLFSASAALAYDRGPYEGFFKDVSIGYWAVNAIEAMNWIGIMKGPDDHPGYFEPEGAVSRAQLAVVAARLNDRIEALETRISALQQQMEQSSSSSSRGYSSVTTSDPKAARDSQRRADINTILNSIYQFALDHQGRIPDGIGNTAREICQTGVEDCEGRADLSPLEATYLKRIPTDPLTPAESNGTGYTVRQDTEGRVTVSAPKAEAGTAISVTR
jgi:hypothetical protein